MRKKLKKKFSLILCLGDGNVKFKLFNTTDYNYNITNHYVKDR